MSPAGKSPCLRRWLRAQRACQQLNIRRSAFRRELRNRSVEGPIEPSPDRSPELTRARQHARIASTMAEHHQVIHLRAQPRPRQIATGQRLWALHAGPKLSPSAWHISLDTCGHYSVLTHSTVDTCAKYRPSLVRTPFSFSGKVQSKTLASNFDTLMAVLAVSYSNRPAVGSRQGGRMRGIGLCTLVLGRLWVCCVLVL